LSNIDRKAIMRDAKMIADALDDADPARRAFVLRLRRSFHTWGSLTTSMREALRPDIIASSSQ
jgi:hypothetical protein